MKHDQPELIDALAAEYVLGTLQGAARRRFERWRAESWHIDRRVETWDGRLIALAMGLTPLAPAPAVWQGIEEKIRLLEASRPAVERIRRPRVALRALAAALVLCAIVGGGFVAWRMTESLSLQPVATIKGAQGPVVWSIELDVRHQRLRAVALAGAAPVSLGILPDAGQLERTLSQRQWSALAQAGKVAVSLEPLGGSPTGAPTGPVLYVAEHKKNA
jgi:anti-sigma-K factor RskA